MQYVREVQSADCSRKATCYVIRRSFWINFQSEKIKSVPYWGKSNAAGHSFNRMYNEVLGFNKLKSISRMPLCII